MLNCCLNSDPPRCAYGFSDEDNLRIEWTDKADPVMYRAPVRRINFNCIGPGNLSQFLVGAYISGGGESTGADLNIRTTEGTTTHRYRGIIYRG